MNHIFKIRKEEKWAVIVALLVFAALNTLMVCYHFTPFTKGGNHIGYWSLFTRYYQLSGFDDNRAWVSGTSSCQPVV